MRFRHRDGSVVHLAYCTNVHPAEDLDGVIGQLARFAGPVRKSLGASRLGVGLWLPAALTAHLRADARALDRLAGALDEQQLEAVTFNGFPYRSFHAPVVKHDVYRPDWSEPERLAYTLDLAFVAARLAPAGVDTATISTLPFGWRHDWTADRDVAARRALGSLGDCLAMLADRTGTQVHVGIEPEPGCVVETTDQAARALVGLGADHLGVCLDACHLAVQFEDPQAAVTKLHRAGVPVVKAQLSAALRVPRPDAKGLAAFAEPRFLHQTRERVGGVVRGSDDLDAALAGGLPGHGEWRVHFHVPVHFDGGVTTQPQLRKTLEALVGGPQLVTHHLEVETYTWSVLPPDQRPRDDAGLVEGLARELAWTRERLLELGLTEIDP